MPPPPTGFASLIVADFAALFAKGETKVIERDKSPGHFAEFHGKRVRLLWRGGRGDFLAKDFHCRCDGRPNTLTLIEDTEVNILGGFTPVK